MTTTIPTTTSPTTIGPTTVPPMTMSSCQKNALSDINILLLYDSNISDEVTGSSIITTGIILDGDICW